jgi:tetratricopeptide (TPR) repeat protein
VRRVLDHRPGSLGLDRLPGLGGGPRRTGLPRWVDGLLRGQSFPTEPFSLGLFHYFRGETLQAAERFVEAVSRSRGAYFEIYNNLGSALFRLGRYPEARACYRIVLDEAPGNRIARERLERIPD